MGGLVFVLLLFLLVWGWPVLGAVVGGPLGRSRDTEGGVGGARIDLVLGGACSAACACWVVPAINKPGCSDRTRHGPFGAKGHRWGGTMRASVSSLGTVGLCLLLAGPAAAAVTPSPPKELERRATVVVVGRLTGLEVREEPAELHGVLATEYGRLGYVDLALYYTLEVTAVEKGEGVRPGDRVVVRAFVWKERKRAYPEDPGHSPLPAVGQEVRAYLSGRSVLFPNGFAPPQPVGAMTDREFFRAQSRLPRTGEVEPLRVDGPKPASDGGPGWVAGGIAAAVTLALVAVAVVLYRRGQAGRKPDGPN